MNESNLVKYNLGYESCESKTIKQGGGCGVGFKKFGTRRMRNRLGSVICKETRASGLGWKPYCAG